MTGVLEVLTGDGDLKITWSSADPESVTRAKAEFDRLKSEGYGFFAGEMEVKRLTAKRLKGATELTIRSVREFEPRVQRTVAVRPMRGG
jgi:hypothetical protein